MEKREKVSLPLARRMALRAQLLNGRSRLPNGKEGIAQAIEMLGYIQIDTINVIQRAHHHTLWTRRPDYNAEMLHELQARDRRIFEYWGHALSYLPISDYRYYLPRMRGFDDPAGKWFRSRYEKYGHLMKPCLKRIREEGPLGAKDFKSRPDASPGAWWDAKPEKVALELLFWRGDLMITERRRFERIYDLTERVLPRGINTCMPDNDELGRFWIHRALLSYGVALEKEIRSYIHGIDSEILTGSLRDTIETGAVMRVTVKGAKDKCYYALSENIRAAAGFRRKTPRLFILSPFDNCIIQRDRIRRLFGFNYALECFVPPAKREYGYFVLPILWGEEFAGRFDPKADRKKKTLIIHHFYLESDFRTTDAFYTAVAQKLWEFARFNECNQIVVKTTSPARVKRELVNQLKR
ncbi:MAG: YcaQ family DNA glycosylase [Candidatus Zixiibacteriota bacterium]|nr:MAG: YcaQ family DNA glycosylase [candidate division Zixibacteria bacterium]